MKKQTGYRLSYSELMNGGNIIYQMGEKPNTKRGIGKEDRPFSVSESKVNSNSK